MNYPLFLLLFLAIPIAVLALLLREKIRARWWGVTLALTILLALLYTSPWDNYLVATGVWFYDPARVWNIILGYVPLEEYLFFVLQPILGALITLGLLRQDV
jgi:lycopene cyclase domain-containing protein